MNLAHLTRIGLRSLGVTAASVKAIARGEDRRLADVAKAYADNSARGLTSRTGGEHLAPGTAPTWTIVFVD